MRVVLAFVPARLAARRTAYDNWQAQLSQSILRSRASTHHTSFTAMKAIYGLLLVWSSVVTLVASFGSTGIALLSRYVRHEDY